MSLAEVQNFVDDVKTKITDQEYKNISDELMRVHAKKPILTNRDGLMTCRGCGKTLLRKNYHRHLESKKHTKNNNGGFTSSQLLELYSISDYLL